MNFFFFGTGNDSDWYLALWRHHQLSKDLEWYSSPLAALPNGMLNYSANRENFYLPLWQSLPPKA